ncbi:transglutaminase-like cysteine peptidase [Neorhizobium alkalisoli]|uniref:transglutaminase-like cysteine peptidase n=1 Tax=Neorhizobium alkalisoli TaxID=528178 RepID=UPI000CF9529A|nr:transglutaminase-like cysteine peptidase [Neorhizobium alkalisoli]
MIKKLIISAVVLTALIAGKEANAAGAGGFARALSSAPAVQVQVAENRAIESQKPIEDEVLTLTFEKRSELLRVNSAVNGTVTDLDSYFDSVAGGPVLEPSSCFDCADLKRQHLISLGWSPKAMRIAYAVGSEGRVERVLAISTDRGDVILGNDSPMIDLSGSQAAQPAMQRQPLPAVSHYDI